MLLIFTALQNCFSASSFGLCQENTKLLKSLLLCETVSVQAFQALGGKS